MKSRLYILSILLALLCEVLARQNASAQAQDAEATAAFKEAFALAQTGKFAEAEQPLNRLLAETNNKALPMMELLGFRGFLRAESGRFEPAAADFEKAIEIQPSEQMLWFVLTPLLVQTGELDEYRTRCHEMLNRFGKTTDGNVAERTAKCCLLIPSGGTSDDLALATKMAEKSVELAKKGQSVPWRLMTRGLAEYREGHFASAVGSLELAQKQLPGERNTSHDMCQADVYLVSAMAHHQLKHPDEANAALAHGKLIIRTKLPSVDSRNLGPSWWDVLMTYTILSEARTTVEGAAAPAQK